MSNMKFEYFVIRTIQCNVEEEEIASKLMRIMFDVMNIWLKNKSNGEESKYCANIEISSSSSRNNKRKPLFEYSIEQHTHTCFKNDFIKYSHFVLNSLAYFDLYINFICLRERTNSYNSKFQQCPMREKKATVLAKSKAITVTADVAA